MADWWLFNRCQERINSEKMFVRNFREDDYHWEIGSSIALRIAFEMGTPVSVGNILYGIRVGRITFGPLKNNLLILRRNDESTINNEVGYLPGFLVEMEDETMKKQTTPYGLFYKPKTSKQLAMNVIKNVIFNDPATIVIWTDNTKTIVKADGEPFDPEKGLAMAISKKFFGNKGYYYDIFKKWLPKEEETKHAGTNEKSEHEVAKEDEDIETITLKEFCSRRNITKNKAYGMIHRNEIDVFKNGRGSWMVRIHTRN